MTAVAPPLTFQPSTRIGWTSNGNGFGAMNSDDVSRMFTPGPRKSVQRQNSSSSISSTSSTSSTATVAASPVQTNGVAPAAAEAGSWATRKKPTRGLWPPGKAEPATGISTARPQTVNSATSGPTATSGLTAIQAPLIPSQQMANGTAPTNGVRSPAPQAPPVILHLTPLNNTFERKTITVPYYPEVLRIGRQTNQKTIPTPLNGYFDSKVLSRQHAEIYADRDGRIFIRDVKSSNGTFVNGDRLSPENRESDPRELGEGNLLELGIDIVSEDQKTVVHHKVSAKVEHAGFFGQNNDPLNFGDLDPSNGSPLVASPSPLRRNGSQGALAGRGGLNAAMNQAANGVGAMSQQQHMRNWLNPISMEHVIKRFHAELKWAEQNTKDLARAKETIAGILDGKTEAPTKESKSASEKSRPSPIKSKTDLKAHFSEPPAPPPSAPLPEKPDVARALADPLIQPLLRRNDTARPSSEANSPTRPDHSSDILRLCEELKIAKGELSNQNQRMKTLEDELAHERSARENAEERARGLEQGERRDSPRDSFSPNDMQSGSVDKELSSEAPNLQVQLDRLRTSMDEMKQQMEAYRRRAETAETERDEVRQSLAEMIEQRRKNNSERTDARSPSHKSPRTSSKPHPNLADTTTEASKSIEPNGHAVAPTSAPLSPTSDILLERAGVEEGQPITPEQAKLLTQFLTQEILTSADGKGALWLGSGAEKKYHGREIASAMAVVFVGVALMGWMNGWVRTER